jgi:bifunctional non-homologous end joining protein LigD
MPLFQRKAQPDPPPDADDWRPQRFGRGGHRGGDVIIEPGWGGVRVLARFDGATTHFTDEEGIDCTPEFDEVAAAVTESVLAEELILDGYLTVEPTQVVTGKPLVEIEAPTAGQMMSQMLAGNRIARPAAPKRQLEPDRPIAFVAVDLLRLDGTPLLNVPLLERKRLLDGSLKPADRVRITPYIRPPIGSFMSTWRGLGFRELAYKAANSRYLPDVRNDDWSITRIPLR